MHFEFRRLSQYQNFISEKAFGINIWFGPGCSELAFINEMLIISAAAYLQVVVRWLLHSFRVDIFSG